MEALVLAIRHGKVATVDPHRDRMSGVPSASRGGACAGAPSDSTS
jgi:hypothetical protein